MSEFLVRVPVQLDPWNVAAFRQLMDMDAAAKRSVFEDLLCRQFHRVICEYVRRVTDGDLAVSYQPTESARIEGEVPDESVPAVFAAWWKNATCGHREEFLERIGATRHGAFCEWLVKAL